MRGIRTSTTIAILTIGLLAGSAFGVGAQDEVADPMAPAWVKGAITWASDCSPTTATNEDGVRMERDTVCQPRTVTSDDSRLAGTSAIIWNKNVYVVPDTGARAIRSVVEDIRGEDGGWVCRTPAVVDTNSTFFAEPLQGSELSTCTGDGANAGLMAVLVFTTVGDKDEFEGLIFPGELPPQPDLPVAE